MKSEPLTSPYMTTAEVAAYLRMTPAAVRDLRHRDDTFPRGIKIGKQVITHRDDIAAYLKAKATERALAA